MLSKNKNVFKKKLDSYRKEIEKVDNKIIELLDQRGKLVKSIGIIKKKNKMVIYQPEREKEIIERMKFKSKILTDRSIESIWREIIKACKLLQAIEGTEKLI
jgi:chorismate mutase